MKELLSPGFWLLSTVQSHRDKRIMMSMSMSNLFISIKLLSFLIHISHSYARHIISTMLQSTSMISRNYKSKKLKFVWQIYLFRFEQLYQIQARSAACESVKSLVRCYETEEMWLLGLPIWVSTLSSHCRGPCRWISIQHGVEVTSWNSVHFRSPMTASD